MKGKLLLSAFIALYTSVFAQKTIKTLEVPAQNAFCMQITEGGKNFAILPSGRFVSPVGKVTRITRGAFGLAIAPDESKALVLHHNGVVTVMDLRTNEGIRVPSYNGKIKPLDNETFLGVAVSKDNKTAYLSGGDKGNVVVFDAITYKKIDSISLNGTINGETFDDSFTSDLTINPLKNELLVLDRGNNRLVRIDILSKKITASIPVGRIPFGISLSKDGKKAFVANVGLYDYPLATGVTPTNKDSMHLKFPAFAIPSKEADTEGVTLPDGRFIPALGSALAEEAMSVWVVDLDKNQVVAKLKTGLQIGEKIEEVEIMGGASPNSVAVGSKFAYISNATNDLISIIDIQKNKIIGDIKLTVDKRIDKYRGLMPFGLTLSKDEKTLYVALLGFNAVAVVDVQKRKTLGLIPTGWGTTRVQLFDKDSKLAILSARGLGAGQNGGKDFKKPIQGTYVGDIQLGTFQIVDVPNADVLKTYTQQVLDNTFKEIEMPNVNKICPPQYKASKSPIRHVVYITKENRTYDEVFGQLKQGSGDASLARFGLNVDIKFKLKKDTSSPETDSILRGVNVSQNHHKIAQEWAFSDNFYCDSDASIHGHHWMMGTIPNEYVEANSAADAEFKAFSKAKGRRFPKTTGGVDPEDYNEIGGIWDNLNRNKISYFNFGETNEAVNSYEEKFDTIFGASNSVVFPLPKAVFDHTSRDYAGYNTNIPDQFRVEQFEREFTKRWLSGKDTMPAFIGLQLPNDHTAKPRPEDGYPFAHSYVADNDLALGRMLDFLSKTPYWKSTLVIVTEDDPQGGVDHIDAHRSILMMAGPYVKRGYVSHKHANFGSILKTIYHILGVPYVNQYDATATLLDDYFTETPNFKGYEALENDPSVFQPEKAMKVYGRDFDWRVIKQGAKFDNENEQRIEHYRQQTGGN
jgi:DNA-binding beta-propeller fold protein YncE